MQDTENENGRSMIEMLGVLAIIGVLSVGGIAGYSKAMMRYRINKTIEQITMITGNVRTFFSTQGHYCALASDDDTLAAIIRKAKLVPEEMWNSTYTALENPFGGGFSLAAGPKGDNDRSKGIDDCLPEGSDTFYMSLRGIPEEACIELASHDWASVGINALSRNGNYVFRVKTPLSVDEAIQFCVDFEKHDGYINFFFDIDVNSNMWKSEFTDCALPDGC